MLSSFFYKRSLRTEAAEERREQRFDTCAKLNSDTEWNFLR